MGENASDLYKELGEVFCKHGLPSRDWEKLAKLYNKAESARGLSVVVDSIVWKLQDLQDRLPLNPDEHIDLGDCIVELYDYNQAYKTSAYNQKCED